MVAISRRPAVRSTSSVRWALLATFTCAVFLPRSAHAIEEWSARASVSDPYRILLQATSFDTRQMPPVSKQGVSGASRASSEYLIVQFDRPIDEEAKARIEQSGVDIIGYIPNRALLVRASVEEEAALDAEVVRWVGEYRAEYKVSPEIGSREHADLARAADDHFWLTVEVFPGEDLRAAAAAVEGTGAVVLAVDDGAYAQRLQVRARPAQIESIAQIPAVQWIEEWPEITDRNDSNGWILQSNVLDGTPLWDRGIRGAGQIVGHIDGLLKMDSCYFMDPVDNTPGPNHRKVVAYRSSTGQGAQSHGTHTAGTIAGDQEPIQGVAANAGLAYQARISHTNRADLTGFGNTTSNLAEYLQFAHDDGARVHTNSWGDDGTMQYTTWARDIDLFSRMNEDALVGFAVTNTAILRTPENAKNCLAVGATRDTPDQDQHSSGGTGPTIDGRRKPEIYAPGRSTVSASTTPCGTSSSSGTSMACPAVMGAAALVRQYYEEGWHPSGVAKVEDAFVPTGALVKATLLNATVDMSGIAGYPSNQEGWGRLLLDDAVYFSGDHRVLQLWDVRHAEGLVTDEVREYQIEAHGGGITRVTLVFTDEPATVGAAFAPVNDLDLEITDGIVTYFGNAIVDGVSTDIGAPDPLNNVEMAILPGFVPTTWTVRVRARQVVGDPQGYALVVTGDLDDPAAAPEAIAARAPIRLHPNPFAPAAGSRDGASIQFELDRTGDTEVTIHDIAGRRVRTLVHRKMTAGAQNLSWDGRGNAGETLPAGSYFIRIFSGGSELGTRRAILLP